jgi:hypothetical protein
MIPIYNENSYQDINVLQDMSITKNLLCKVIMLKTLDRKIPFKVLTAML